MHTRRNRLSLLAGVAPILLFALTSVSAHAHAAIVASEPAAGQKLTSAPGSVSLRFTEPINTKLSRATVTDPTAQRFDGGPAGAQEIQVPLSTNAVGVYRVTWTTLSAIDGHALNGSFQFGVGVAPPEGEGTTALAPQPTDILIAVARGLEYAGLFMAVGMLLLRFLASRRPPIQWVGGSLQVPLVLAFAGGVVVVIGEALSAAPRASTQAIVDYLANGTPGVARLARLAVEAIAPLVAVTSTRFTLVPVGAALVALAAAGHAAAVRPAGWGIGADAAHLLAAALWAGGILSLATLRPPGGWRGTEAIGLVSRFSRVGLPAFLFTVGLGVIRGSQELSDFGDLVNSSYGQVLTVKVALVVAMVPLSLLAWRRRVIAPRLETMLAVAVIAAAALLAAHPLPPSRAREAEALGERLESQSALPSEGDLTFGGNAGEILVGLTLRPGIPGSNTALVYLLPLDGEQGARTLSARLSRDGQSTEMAPCGASCRSAEVELQEGERVEVSVGGANGGTATFDIPALLPAPDGTDLIEGLRARMDELRTYRLDEVLGPAQPPVRAAYAFQAPDRLRYNLSSGSELIWIDGTRYFRDSPSAAWQVEQTGFAVSVPQFIWDLGPTSDFIAPRLAGSEPVDGIDTQVVSFFARSGSLPVWFRLWVDAEGLVRRAEMRAPAHFMDHHYYDFDAPLSLEAPVG